MNDALRHKPAATARRAGRRLLKQEISDAVVAPAARTVGVPMLDAEAQQVRRIAEEARRAHSPERAATTKVEEAAKGLIRPEVRTLVGARMSAVIAGTVSADGSAIVSDPGMLDLTLN